MQFARATTANFETTFLDINEVPLVPADPNSNPSVVIKDPTGTTMAVGVGRPIGQGKYVFSWFVPEDAEINTVDRPWTISWFFLTEGGHNKDASATFNVIDKVDPLPEEKKWTYLVRAGKSERLFLPLQQIPEEIGIDILDASYNTVHSIPTAPVDLVTTEIIQQATEATPIDQRKIGRMTRDGKYFFFFNTEPLNQGEYIIFWKVREQVVSPEDEVQQLLRVPEMAFWRLAQPLRILLDKLQKRVGWVQAYSDSDLYEYILRGLDMANMTQPATNWTLSSIPIGNSRGVIDAILLYAAMWGLTAQQILETELTFDFNGQTVTLGYNHDYGGVLSSINDMLGKFAESKQLLYRIANGPGVVGVRPKNWRFTQRVWRVDNWGFGSPYDVSVLLTQTGL
jgi:hypothetical protein